MREKTTGKKIRFLAIFDGLLEQNRTDVNWWRFSIGGTNFAFQRKEEKRKEKKKS